MGPAGRDAPALHQAVPVWAALDVRPRQMDATQAIAARSQLGRHARGVRAGRACFSTCWEAPILRVAIENPEMNDLARDRMPAGLPSPQMVQPFWFGEPAYKATGWYLRGLPPLRPTHRLPEPERGSDEWRRWNRVHRMPPGPERARLRSRSYPGMMRAAAEQWGGHAMREIAA